MSSPRSLCPALLPWLLCLASACGPLGAAGLVEGPPGAERATVVLQQTPGRLRPERLRLRPGRYVLRVENRGVGHPVGLRLSRVTAEHGIGELVPGAALPGLVSDGAAASTGVIDLAPGRYSYRSAENPTPHYFLVVE